MSNVSQASTLWRFPVVFLSACLALVCLLPVAVLFYLWRAHALVRWWPGLSRWWALVSYNLLGLSLIALSAVVGFGQCVRAGKAWPSEFNAVLNEIVGTLSDYFPDKGF